MSKVTSKQSGKIDLVHLEDIQEDDQKPTKKQKLVRHWKRFWFCYLVGLVVFLAIFLPLL